ncbi:DivIVA domain-containing protein [Agromyces archimandritae]|uniref:DivIVA domain-containing protein n=1 Tax=Agromyces archimandritae TaxID=2781962 RepID=A0A975FME3_9MICO|nr:DivIVA domain-containing protein [Agromyces archimandritae]QTX03661.1 DivIVA domain-containing protein [Agromyces archimandritae]
MTPDDLPPFPDSTQEKSLAGAVSRLPQTGTSFSLRHMGGGYDRNEVDAFLAELTRTVADVRAALEEDRRELTALRAENTRLQAAADAGADLEQEVTLGAVGLLSQAQSIADKAVADAEQYARDLVIAARTQYREAQEQAAEEAAAAGVAAPAPVTQTPPPAMPEIDYVRTYAQVAQIQLRSVLDALTEQVDRLGTLPQAGDAAGAPADDGAAPEPSPEDAFPDEEPNWLPAIPPQPTIQRQSYISPTR